VQPDFEFAHDDRDPDPEEVTASLRAAKDREIVLLREALADAAERIYRDDCQIHSEWGVGPYKPDPLIEELRALSRGELPDESA